MLLLCLICSHIVDDGSMPKDKREASLEKIRNSKTTRCILISFKAGSTGEFTSCFGRLPTGPFAS